jgi:hypothetical protein
MQSLLRGGCLLLTVAVIYGATRLVAAHYGLHERWLETGDPYTVDSLRDRVKKDTVRAARYVCPVLVPLDLLFLVFLGATLAIVSVMSASAVSWLSGAAWLFVLLPALYVGVDLAEDALLVRLLAWPDTVTTGMVTVVRALTSIKIWAVKLAFAQTVLLAVVAVVAALWRR